MWTTEQPEKKLFRPSTPTSQERSTAIQTTLKEYLKNIRFKSVYICVLLALDTSLTHAPIISYKPLKVVYFYF